ncbi:MAG: hypothetical protein ACR2NT_12090 [Acidimicrobiia bacterium]
MTPRFNAILFRRLWPAVPWIPWLPVAALVGVLAWMIKDLQPDFSSRQLFLRSGLLVAALGLSFVFDDPAAPTTDAVPSALIRSRVVRVVASLPPWAVMVGILIWAGASDGLEPTLILSSSTVQQLPVGRLLLEATTMAAWSLAAAAVVASRWDEEPGRIASAFLVGSYVVSWLIPEDYKPWTLPTDNRWTSGQPWWWAALIVGVGVAVVSSWDSQRGRFFRRSRIARGGGSGSDRGSSSTAGKDSSRPIRA